MEQHDHHRRKARVTRTLAALMVGFTALFTALGLTCAATAHVPLARHRVHGRDAVLLYKAVRWAGLALAALPYVVDLLLLLFLACLRFCCCCCGPPPDTAPSRHHLARLPPAAAASPKGETAPASTGSRVDWDAVRAPTYEYLAEVIRAFTGQERLEEGSRLQSSLADEERSF